MSISNSPTFSKLRAIWPYFAGTRWAFILSAVGAAIGGATESSLAYLMNLLVDKGFQKDQFPLWMIPLAIIALFIVRGIAGFVVNYTLSWAANQATLRMRAAMFSRLLDAHPAIFSARSASSLINTVVYEVLGGVTQLVGAAQTLIKDSFTVVALLGFLLWTNWKLTLFIAAIVPAVAYTMRAFGRRMHRLTVEAQGATDRLAYVVEENVMAWRIVRLHGAEAVQDSRFRQASNALRRLLLKSTVAASVVTPVTQLFTACALAAVIAAALWQSSSSGTTVGGFVGFLTAAIGLATPLKHLSEVAGPVSRGLAAVDRGVTLIDHTPAETGGDYAPARAEGRIKLEGVALQYRDDQAPALEGLGLEIRAGETVALVGPSGAGKTSLVNLLPRFLDPTRGVVSLDDVPLPDWKVNALREQFALVSQDVVLFNDSVAANICLGGEFDRERVRAALAGANLLEFVETLPQGIDSAIGHNGSQLSGGQRQRLAIARAIYKDAPVLILDEATSALDSESERLVQSALELLMAGRTSIVIAHRLSTIEAADRVVVLDKGRVVEQGTHAQLLAQGGLFARLHALQFKT